MNGSSSSSLGASSSFGVETKKSYGLEEGFSSSLMFVEAKSSFNKEEDDVGEEGFGLMRFSDGVTKGPSRERLRVLELSVSACPLLTSG